MSLLKASHGSVGSQAPEPELLQEEVGRGAQCPPQPKWAWAAGIGGSSVTSSFSRVEKLHLFDLESGISIPKAHQVLNWETQVPVPVPQCRILAVSLFSDSGLG